MRLFTLYNKEQHILGMFHYNKVEIQTGTFGSSIRFYDHGRSSGWVEVDEIRLDLGFGLKGVVRD